MSLAPPPEGHSALRTFLAPKEKPCGRTSHGILCTRYPVQSYSMTESAGHPRCAFTAVPLQEWL